MSAPWLATRVWVASLAVFVAVGGDGDTFAMDPELAEYWIHGEGAAKIRWCTKGSFRRAQNALREHIPPEQLDGAVANLFRRACGKNPGPHND